MSAAAREALIHVLRSAYSGERAAGFAYRGHWRSVSDAGEAQRIREIEAEEWHHRTLVGELLATLGAHPSRARELRALVVGRTLQALCHVSGWFPAMYGAGKLERGNIVEYEDAARHAADCGHGEMVDCLLTMAEVEWDHEQYFRARLTGHGLLRLFPLWPAPPPRASIRAAFAAERKGAA